jgi:fructosamine-3-kinase
LARDFPRAYQRHVPIDDGYAARKDFYDVSRTLVWMKSLAMHGNVYAKGSASQSHEAARQHLRSLLQRSY